MPSLLLLLLISLLNLALAASIDPPTDFVSLRVLDRVNQSITPSGTIVNASTTVGPHEDFPVPTTGCVELAIFGHWQCDYNFPTLDQIRYWMDPANGGGTTAQRVPLFYSGWGSEAGAIRALGWGRAFLQSLPDGPKDSYDYFTGLNMEMDTVELITGQQVVAGDDSWYAIQHEWMEQNPDRFRGWGWPALQPNDDRAPLTFEACYFQALAEAAQTEDAYIVAPLEANLEQTWWHLVEFPYLTQNPSIQHIYAVDPRPPSEGGGDCPDVEEIWSRPDGNPVIGSIFSCPTRPYA